MMLGKGFSFAVLDGIDPKDYNLVAAGILYTTSGNIEVLIRLETNAQAKACRLTVRSSNAVASKAAHSAIAQQISLIN